MSRELPESLGNTDADRDQLLNDDTFVKTKCYQKVLKDENFLILGRKGVGKSAFAKMMAKLETGKTWKLVFRAGSPDVYFNDLERDFSGSDLLKSIASSAFMYQMWEHFIIENCMKLVLKDRKKAVYTGHREIIFSYLKSTGQSELDAVSTISSFFGHMLGMIAESNLKLGPASIKTGSGEQLRSFFNKRYNYQNATEALFNYLAESDCSILFLIDDVDENVVKNSNAEIVGEFINQLIRVVTDINYKALDLKHSKNVTTLSVKAFVPTDIYSWLERRHDDKQRSNRVELTWTDDELRAMFTKRFSEICKLGKMPEKQMIARYFGDKIFDTYGQPRDVLTYIVEHTFGRPRDVMNLYGQLRNVLGENLTIPDAYKAIEEYIADTVQSVIAEYSFVQPNIDEILQGFNKSDAVCDWDYIKLKVSQKSAAIQLSDVPKVIATLYELGLFGILQEIPNQSTPPIHSLKVNYCYDARKRALKNASFLMHPIFRFEYLMEDNSKEFIKAHRKEK